MEDLHTSVHVLETAGLPGNNAGLVLRIEGIPLGLQMQTFTSIV